MSANRGRYCQCGALLARDHAGNACGACERQVAGRRAMPPAVPSGFWETTQFRAAFSAQHIGRAARAYRRHPFHADVHGPGGISQELLGQWLDLTQAQISRIENGPPVRNLDSLAHWARTLAIPGEYLWFTLPDRAAAVRPPEPAAAPVTGSDAVALMAFRSADSQVGGGHLYASVVGYLHTDVGPRLFGSDNAGDDLGPFTAAAALTEMAGWMAHDAGRDTAAGSHFRRSHALAEAGGDRRLGAHVLGSMSHLASHLGHCEEAAGLARRAQETLRTGPAGGQDKARLLALEARGQAGLHRKAECVSSLARAQEALGGPAGDPVSPWVSEFDEASLASEASRCLRQIGDLAGARRQAERIIALRPGYRTRSRALAQVALAGVLAAQGKYDEACAAASSVLVTTKSLASRQVTRQLLHLRRQLEPHRASAAVADLLAGLDELA